MAMDENYWDQMLRDAELSPPELSSDFIRWLDNQTQPENIPGPIQNTVQPAPVNHDDQNGGGSNQVYYDLTNESQRQEYEYAMTPRVDDINGAENSTVGAIENVENQPDNAQVPAARGLEVSPPLMNQFDGEVRQGGRELQEPPAADEPVHEALAEFLVFQQPAQQIFAPPVNANNVLNFRIRVVNAKYGPGLIYENAVNRLYIHRDKRFVLEFSWDAERAHQLGLFELYVRLTVLFRSSEYMDDLVERCQNHQGEGGVLGIVREEGAAREGGAGSPHALRLALGGEGGGAVRRALLFACENYCCKRRDTYLKVDLLDSSRTVIGTTKLNLFVGQQVNRAVKQDRDSRRAPGRGRRQPRTERYRNDLLEFGLNGERDNEEPRAAAAARAAPY